MTAIATLEDVTGLLLPVLKWFGIVLGVLTAVGLVVVRIAAGRLRRQAFGPGGGLR